MVLFLIFGIFIFLIGGMMLLVPNTLYKFNDYMNKIVFHDKALHKSRVILAILIMAVGLLLTYTYYRYGILISTRAR